MGGTGTNLPAKFRATLLSLKGKVLSVDSPLALVNLPQTFAVGMAESSDKLCYDYLFSKLAPMAVDACVQKIPGLEGFSIGDATGKAFGQLDKLTDKYNLTLEMKQDFESDTTKYFAVTGHTQNKELSLTVLGNKPASGSFGVMASIVIDTKLFGELMIGMMGSNPFDSVLALSNLNLAAYVSTSDFSMPNGVTLPDPFSETTQIKTGFCFDGVAHEPATCQTGNGNDSVCALLKDAMRRTGGALGLGGCVGPQGVSLAVKVLNTRFNENVLMTTADIFFKTAIAPPSASIGGSAVLAVKMPELVTFFGTVYVKQQGMPSLLGLGLGMKGMKQDFVKTNINIYDLALATEIGVTGVIPTIAKITIGGGVCFGKYATCKFLVDGEEGLEELLQRPDETAVSTKPEPADYQKQLTLVQSAESAVDMSKTVAAKLYAGFSSEGDAFFYAGITKVSLSKILNVVGREDLNLPNWAASASIEPYAQDECDKNGGAACFAFVSFSAKETGIKELVPPLVIPAGLGMQGRIFMLNSYMVFNVALGSGDLVMKLESSPIRLFKGGLVITRTKDSTEGPRFNMMSNPPAGGCKLLTC